MALRFNPPTGWPQKGRAFNHGVVAGEGRTLYIAETLSHWGRRFETNRAKIAEKYGDRFCRMWEFYLISAEMMFRTGRSLVFQLQLARKRDAAPIVRDYITDQQRRYRKTEERQTTDQATGADGHLGA